MAEDRKKPCYSTENNCLLTLFETGGQDDHLLPHSGLLAGRLHRSNDEELTLVYVTHTVVIKGTDLQVLLGPLQQACLKTVAVGEARTNDKGQKLAIRSIEVSLGSQPQPRGEQPEMPETAPDSVDTIS